MQATESTLASVSIRSLLERYGRAHGIEGRAGEPAQGAWNQDNVWGGIWVSETGGTDKRTVPERLPLLLLLLVQMRANDF